MATAAVRRTWTLPDEEYLAKCEQRSKSNVQDDGIVPFEQSDLPSDHGPAKDSKIDKNRPVLVKTDPALGIPDNFTMKQAEELLGAKYHNIDHFRITRDARLMENAFHHKYGVLPLGVSSACAPARTSHDLTALDHAL
jgi:hypothetical protein